MDFPRSWSPFLTRSSLHLFELSVGFLRSWYIFLKIDALFKKSKITFYQGLGGAFLQSRSGNFSKINPHPLTLYQKAQNQGDFFMTKITITFKRSRVIYRSHFYQFRRSNFPFRDLFSILGRIF